MDVILDLVGQYGVLGVVLAVVVVLTIARAIGGLASPPPPEGPARVDHIGPRWP